MVQSYADAYAENTDAAIAAYLEGLTHLMEADSARSALLLDAARRLRERPAQSPVEKPADAFDAAVGRLAQAGKYARHNALWIAARSASQAGRAFIEAGLDLYVIAVRMGMDDIVVRNVIREGWEAGLKATPEGGGA